MLLVPFPKAAAIGISEACGLPQDLQREIATKFSQARFLTVTDLNEDDKRFFQKDHGDACPGLVRVDFYGDGKPTLAVLFITRDRGKDKIELIVAHEIGKRWATRMLDTVDAVPAPVIWSQPSGRYRDFYGKKEIRAARPVIVLARYESWAILYSWTGNGVTKIWLRD